MKLVSERLIHLSNCRGTTRRLIRRMLRYDPTLKQMYTLSSTKLSHLFSFPMRNAQLLYSDLHNSQLKIQFKKDVTGITILTIVDANYPNMLKQIIDPPLVLYAMGDVSLLSRPPILSVIGTRDPTDEAMAKTEHLITPLIEKKWVIVSGMAKGIDSYAHYITLNNKGSTVAVLGGGFHHIYPRQNIPLFHQIAKNGLVLSEYPPNVRPTRYHFPERNRIISGLSFGTLVIEAKERSGTLITVDQALDQGREVYAVPGSPLVDQAKGCNEMIQEGAKLTLDPEDILEDWKYMEHNLFNI